MDSVLCVGHFLSLASWNLLSKVADSLPKEMISRAAAEAPSREAITCYPSLLTHTATFPGFDFTCTFFPPRFQEIPWVCLFSLSFIFYPPLLSKLPYSRGCGVIMLLLFFFCSRFFWATSTPPEAWSYILAYPRWFSLVWWCFGGPFDATTFSSVIWLCFCLDFHGPLDDERQKIPSFLRRK